MGALILVTGVLVTGLLATGVLVTDGETPQAMVTGLLTLLDLLAVELLLFAGIFFLIGAVDDLIIDAIWAWQRFVRKPDADDIMPTVAAQPHEDWLRSPDMPPSYAIFIPAWEEADVIADMVGHCLHRWPGRQYRLYVGIYPNDPATGFAALRGARGDNRLRLVPLTVGGPTSKADCLNHIWRAMQSDEREQHFTFRSVVLHDAEDLVHPGELDVYDRFLPRYDFVQLPVSPLIDPRSRLVGGHYADEFAEAHGKTMPVRSRLGVAMPCAGVGCAFRREALQSFAAASPANTPFAADSLTEDYELGLRIHAAGGKGIFVRAYDDAGQLVATQAYFPSKLSASVRQKTRWMIGISLAGWDRTGWGKGAADIWMRARDRRSALAALVLVAAYLGLLLWVIVSFGSQAGYYQLPPFDPGFRLLMITNGAILVWRIGTRGVCTAHHYGWRQAIWSVPRMFVGNVIAVMAARRALMAYATSLRGHALAWDKTRHHIPAAPATRPKPMLRAIGDASEPHG